MKSGIYYPLHLFTFLMARMCEHCGKTKQIGNTRKLLRGHYNVTGKREFRPNLQKIKHEGAHLLLCVNCIRTLNKAAKVTKSA